MRPPVRTEAPSTDLLSLEEAKEHARVDDTDSDVLLATLIESATDHLDGWSGILGRCLISQTWRQDFAHWEEFLRMPFPDVQEVTLTYRDSDDAEQTVSASSYELVEDGIGSRIDFFDDFTPPPLSDRRKYPVSVSLVAGYGDDATSVPAALRAAALMHVAHLFENREVVVVGSIATNMPMAYDALISPYQRKPV